MAIVGPPKVGKTTLFQCIVKNFTRQKLTNIQGPVTVVSGLFKYCLKPGLATIKHLKVKVEEEKV